MQLFRSLRTLVIMAALLIPQTGAADGRSIIVLDASGSMWGQIDGRAKLEIARDSLNEVLKSIPPETELGLIVYGHREKGSCSDIELIVPPAAGTAQAISDAAAQLQFLGKTPLTDAVRMAARELRSTEEKATVILITDGIETCAADPCALGAELEASGVDFTAHVVGFGLTADEGKQVSCLATNTGGLFITADDMAGLTDALQTTVLAAVDLIEPEPAAVVEPPPPPPAVIEFNFAPKLFYATGKPVPADEGAAWKISQLNPDGSAGRSITTIYGDPSDMVAPGSYLVQVSLDEAMTSFQVTLTDDAVFADDVLLDAGRLIVNPRASVGGPVEPNAAVALSVLDRNATTFYGNTDVVVPAGDIGISVSLGNASVSERASVTAGETTEIDVIIGAGIAVLDAYYVDGMKVEGGAHAFFVEKAKKALDGTRERLETQYGEGSTFTLPPGDYVAIASSDLAQAETPFAVKTGERADVAVILNAGVMAVTMPGATSVEVYEGKVDIKGNRARLLTEYTDMLTQTAPAGDYLIKVMRGDVVSEATLTVKAGERTELTIP